MSKRNVAQITLNIISPESLMKLLSLLASELPDVTVNTWTIHYGILPLEQEKLCDTLLCGIKLYE